MEHLCLAEELEELRKREKEKGITPDWELDAFMKAEIRKGKKESIITDLVIKMLGLDVSATGIGIDAGTAVLQFVCITVLNLCPLFTVLSKQRVGL